MKLGKIYISSLGALVTIAFGCASTPTAVTNSTGAASAASNTTNQRHPDIKPIKDSHALAELKAMSDALTAASTLRFTAMALKPLRGPNDQWVHIMTSANVEMQRPNQLFISTGGDAFPQRIYFDGKNFSVHATETKLYSIQPMQGKDIDGMLAQASKDGGVTFSFADLLLKDPWASWTHDLEGALFIGESNRNGEKLNHIALTASDVDWEIWTDQKTHLPRVVYVKYVGVHRTPALMIEFSNWKLGTKIPASDFSFKAPADSKRVSFAAPGEKNNEKQ